VKVLKFNRVASQ